jgi:hypothetical protein
MIIDFLIFSYKVLLWILKGDRLIALHNFMQHPVTSGMIFPVQDALLSVSNYSLERMVDTHGSEAYFSGHRSIQGRYTVAKK